MEALNNPVANVSKFGHGGGKVHGMEKLGMGTKDRRSADGENRAFIRDGRDMVQGGVGGYSALIDLIGSEGQ